MEGRVSDEKSVVGKIYNFLKSLKPTPNIVIQSIEHEDGSVSDNVIVIIGRGLKTIIIDAHVDTVGIGDKSQWIDSNPFSAYDGEVQYIGDNKVLLKVRNRELILRIRDLMDEIWRKRRLSTAEVIYGRGSYDDKEAITSVLYTLKFSTYIINQG